MKGRLPVLILAMTWPTVAALLYFVILASPAGAAGEPKPLSQIAYAGTKAVQFALPVVWLGWWQGQSLRPARPDSRGMLPGIGFALIVAAAMTALYFAALRDSPLLKHTPAPLQARVANYGASSTTGYFLLAFFIAVLHSGLEEYYWRWFVFGELQRDIPFAAAAVISGLAFMAHHVVVLNVYFPEHWWTGTVPFSLAVAVGGMFWAWLYHRSRSIWAAWISHLLVDAAILVVGYDLLFRH